MDRLACYIGLIISYPGGCFEIRFEPQMNTDELDLSALSAVFHRKSVFIRVYPCISVVNFDSQNTL
jgi:hypothetical protein